jgi:hypothetical protein
LNQFSSFPLNSIFYTHLFKIAGPHPFSKQELKPCPEGGEKKPPMFAENSFQLNYSTIKIVKRQ